MVTLLITDSETNPDTKIIDTATVMDTYNSSSSVLVTTQTSSKRRKRSTQEEIHTYGDALPSGCKYGNYIFPL